MAKTEDISNKTLATLLVVAIVVSIGGTYVVLQKAPGITGLFTGTSQEGTVTFTSEGVLSIKINDAGVVFGNLTSTANAPCVVDSDNAAPVACTSTVGGTINDWMELENDGNQAAAVNISITAGAFALGTGGFQQYKSVDNESSSCTGAVGTYSTLSSEKSVICTSLAYQDNQDSVKTYFKLSIGTDVAPGPQNQTVTFWAALP